MQDTVDATVDVRPDIDASSDVDVSMDEMQPSIGTVLAVEPPEPEPEIPVHPLAASFPLMEGEDLDALVEDIRLNGQRQPIELIASGQESGCDGVRGRVSRATIRPRSRSPRRSRA